MDIIARNKTDNRVADCEFWYIELKKTLGKKEFNHSFKNIRWIVCWDIASDVKDGTIIHSVVQGDEREFVIKRSDQGGKIYFLDDPHGNSAIKIKVVALKDWLLDEFNIAPYSVE